MKRKFLAAVMSAAMVAGATPVLALAAPAADNVVETQDVSTTETPEADAAEKAVAESQTPAVMTEPAGDADVDVQADEINTQEDLEAALVEGADINLSDKTIELTRPLTISANNVTITGGVLKGTSSVSGNLVTLTADQATLNDVSIVTAGTNKTALHVYGTTLTAADLSIDHSSAAGGAPIIINHGAQAYFSGSVYLTLGDKSWYGVNVDHSYADFSEADFTVANASGTQSAVCMENEGVTGGVNLTSVITNNHEGAQHQQNALVLDSNLSEFIAAKTEAGADIETITLVRDVKLSSPLVLSEPLKLTTADGVKMVITGPDGEKENVVTVTSDDVEISHVTIKTTGSNKSALHVYDSDNVVLNNVTLDNRETAGGAGMIVNGSNVTVKNALEILLGTNSWGGINVDTTIGNASVTFADGSKVTMPGSDKDAIYIDPEDDAAKMEITGAENAGLVADADGNYILAPTETTDPKPGDGDEEKPGDETKPADDKKTDDNKDTRKTKAPQTGDNSNGLYAAAAALIGSGVAAGVVLKKRNEVTK